MSCKLLGDSIYHLANVLYTTALCEAVLTLSLGRYHLSCE